MQSTRAKVQKTVLMKLSREKLSSVFINNLLLNHALFYKICASPAHFRLTYTRYIHKERFNLFNAVVIILKAHVGFIYSNILRQRNEKNWKQRSTRKNRKRHGEKILYLWSRFVKINVISHSFLTRKLCTRKKRVDSGGLFIDSLHSSRRLAVIKSDGMRSFAIKSQGRNAEEVIAALKSV